jgi:chitin disaccharide deacetylase
MPDSERLLIVNADDFGQSPGVNEGIIAAHEHGIVTSTSLMVRWPAASEAARYARSHPAFGVGLHVDLGEMRYSEEEENWVQIYEVVPHDDVERVRKEAERQLADFFTAVGRVPTHLDSHQHVHMQEPVRTVLAGLAASLAVPLRSCTPAIHYCGDFYGQASKGYAYPEGISVARLLKVFDDLPAGTTELGCHPGLGEDVVSMYRTERATEVQTLCDPRVRAAIKAGNIRLISFREAILA